MNIKNKKHICVFYFATSSTVIAFTGQASIASITSGVNASTISVVGTDKPFSFNSNASGAIWTQAPQPIQVDWFTSIFFNLFPPKTIILIIIKTNNKCLINLTLMLYFMYSGVYEYG